WVFGVGTDWDHATGRTVGSNQTVVHQYLATVGDTYWVQRQNATTPAAGTVVTINDTAPTTDRFNLSLCEVLPAGTSTGGDTTAPYSVAWNTTAVTNGSHTLTAMARDAAGNLSSAAITVAVSNSVSINLTVDGATTFQRMDGFGVNLNPKLWNNGELISGIN